MAVTYMHDKVPYIKGKQLNKTSKYRKA